MAEPEFLTRCLFSLSFKKLRSIRIIGLANNRNHGNPAIL
jgi:hypothetical protein